MDARATTASIGDVVEQIAARRRVSSEHRALIVGISGIDGSGKGFVSVEIARQLREAGFNVAVIAADGWLNVPSIRFNDSNPGLHFYDHALRLDQLFDQVISPLRENRSVKCEVDHIDETATSARKKSYNMQAVDVVLLEGIFLFKPDYRRYFDLMVWVDCSFETALQRALNRRQEGLSTEETIRAYQKIYFPAQTIHLERDEPMKAADLVLPNDIQSSE